MSRMPQLTATEIAGLEERYPQAFRGNRDRIVNTSLAVACALALTAFSIWFLDLSLSNFARGLGEFFYLCSLMFPPSSGTWPRFFLFVHALGETLAIALLGTLLAAVFAFPFGFLAARNVIPNFIFHFLTRRLLDAVRGIDTLIWALIWINVVGLGPFAGVLAIMCSDFGSFAKLFSEAIETADRKSVEGVISSGGGRLHAIRFGILPQILPVMLSQVLYFFESNTRSATIIGIVGAGGIGLELSEAIRTLEWQQTSLLVLMILVVVAAIDFLSTKIRLAVIGRRPSSR
jgi:phosphonate transport system permease protein